MASNVNKPPILDGTGQSIKSKLSDILQALQNAAVSLGTAAAKDYTTSVTSGNTDLPTSGAVADAIDNMIEANPSGTATDDLTKIGIDGGVYEVVDDDYQNDEKSFTTNDYSTSTHTFTSSTNITLVTIKGVLSALSVVFNALKTAINDHASVLSNLNLALSGKVTSEQVTFNELSEDGHRFGENRITGTAFTATSDTLNENTNFSTVKTVVNNLADYAEENVEIETLPNTTPYLYRQSPAIGTRVMENALVGCSFGVNQLVSHGNFDETTDWSGNGASISVSNNIGNVTFSSATGKAIHNVNAIANHVYLTVATLKATASNSMPTLASYIGSSGIFKYISQNVTSFQTVYILEKQSSIFSVPQIQIRNAQNPLPSDSDVQAKNVMCFDLTQMFGFTIADYVYSLEQATAGSGIAWLKSQGFDFSKYIDYNTGTLESVNPSAKKVVGFNQWDEEILTGYYNSSGVYVSANNQLCTKNKIRIIPNTDYYFKYPSTGNNICYYDENENFITRISDITPNAVFTTLSNAHYMNLTFSGTYGATYNHDICINFSKTEGTPKNGDYLPYESETYSISQSPLRGVPTLVNDAIVYDGDVRKSDGDVTRKYGIVDLGSLEWRRDTSKSHPFFYTDSLTGIIKHIYDSQNYNHPIICAKYFVLTTISVSASDSEWADASFDKSMVYHSNPTKEYIYIRDDSYTDVTTFKTAMSGVYLVYELAAPTTESLPPYTNPQKSFVGGTEEWLTDNDVPVGHDSEYKKLPPLFEDDYIKTIQEFAEEVPTKIIYQDRAYSYVTIDQRSAAGNYYRFVEEIWKDGYCLIGISLLYWGGAPNMFLPYFQITGANPEPNAHYYIGFMCGENPIDTINAITVRLIWRKAD